MMGFVLNVICPLCGSYGQVYGSEDYEDRPYYCPTCFRKTIVVNTYIHTEYHPGAELEGEG